MKLNYMEQAKKDRFDRHCAIKSTIGEVLRGKYIQEDGHNQNYLLTLGGEKIFRINLVAIVLGRNLQGSITDLSLDDGSGKIIVRSFEENKAIDRLVIGDIVLVVGRVRMYNQETYISPEIIKKISPMWLKVRALELKRSIETEKDDELHSSPEKGKGSDPAMPEESEADGPDEGMVLPVEKLSRLIRDLDDGSGVLIEDVIEKSPLEKTEELIQRMLENGDIFQNSPGRIRVL